MAPSTTIIPFSPHAEGAQATVNDWLGRVAGALQARPRMLDADPGRQARARILQQSALTMLAPVEPRARTVRELLR